MQKAIRNKGDNKPVSVENLNARDAARHEASKRPVVQVMQSVHAKDPNPPDKLDRDYEANRVQQAKREQAPDPRTKGDDSDFSQFGKIPQP